MQNIVTLGQINEALKITSVTAAQLAEMGFGALENKPICEALSPEESRRLRNAKLYQADSIAQIRVALAKRLAAPASCLLKIQEPAPVHGSDCATHSAPAYPAGACDCSIKAAPAAVAVPDGGTPGPWRVRKREKDGEVLGCFVTAPDCQGRAYDADILGDDYDTMERKLADCELIVAAVNAYRAALAATPAADAPLPLLVRDIARELGITCVEACLALKPLGNFSTNTAVTAEMMAKLRECFPERVPASEVAGARERMTAGRACYFMERFLKEEKLLGPNEQAALHYVIDMLEAAAAPVAQTEATWCEYIAGMIGCYLKEPDESPRVKAIAGIIERRLWALPAPKPMARAEKSDSFEAWAKTEGGPFALHNCGPYNRDAMKLAGMAWHASALLAGVSAPAGAVAMPFEPRPTTDAFLAWWEPYKLTDYWFVELHKIARDAWNAALSSPQAQADARDAERMAAFADAAHQGNEAFERAMHTFRERRDGETGLEYMRSMIDAAIAAQATQQTQGGSNAN